METLEQSIKYLKIEIENEVKFLVKSVRNSARNHDIEYDYAKEACRNILNKYFKES